MAKETKAIRIGNIAHKAVKIYAAKTESTVIDVIDAAILWYINEFPASQINKVLKNKPVKK